MVEMRPLLCSTVLPPGPVAQSPELRVPRSDDWATMYDDIERLYVRERRKLRDVMRYVETKYHFSATEQMYKKRFSKWGFEKNARRSAKTSPASSIEEHDSSKMLQERQQHQIQISIPASPDLQRLEMLTLVVLRSVWLWGTSFYESLQMPGGSLASFEHRPSVKQLELEKTKEVGLVLKLAVDALVQGRGTLAGRIARKAFILVEQMFDLDPPALAWNLLVVMYDTVVAHQFRLFEMLLAHIYSLARCRMPDTHPLLTMLSTLREIALQPNTVPCDSSRFSTASPPTSWTNASKFESNSTTSGSLHYSHTLSDALERAWSLNAGILFTQLDTRLIELYSSIDWDSTSMILPASTVDAANKWFTSSEEQSGINTATASPVRSVRPSTELALCVMHQRLITEPIACVSLQDYGIVWRSSIESLRKNWESYLQDQANFSQDTAVMIRALAGLVPASILQDSFTIGDASDPASSNAPTVLSVHARHLANVLKASQDLEHIINNNESVMDADSIVRMRLIIALFEYAYGEIDPRVVQEMRCLQEALTANGNHEEANRIKDDASYRLEQYIQHIPPDTT